MDHFMVNESLNLFQGLAFPIMVRIDLKAWGNEKLQRLEMCGTTVAWRDSYPWYPMAIRGATKLSATFLERAIYFIANPLLKGFGVITRENEITVHCLKSSKSSCRALKGDANIVAFIKSHAHVTVNLEAGSGKAGTSKQKLEPTSPAAIRTIRQLSARIVQSPLGIAFYS
ncbi:hypothetical protein B1219_19535 [Pseudomonas ogarae]|nr:hypothetical protein B1219_19535 [Pseudomonas ogarae]OPG76912.1 hypothetical protein B1218_23625 [Pseudomonas ogarae]